MMDTLEKKTAVTELSERDRRVLDKYTSVYSYLAQCNIVKPEMIENSAFEHNV